MSTENNTIDGNFLLKDLQVNVEIVQSWINKEGDKSCSEQITKSIGDRTDNWGNHIPNPIKISHDVSIYAASNGTLNITRQNDNTIIPCNPNNYIACIKDRSIISRILQLWWSKKQNKDEVVEQLLNREVILGVDTTKRLTIKIATDKNKNFILNAYIKFQPYENNSGYEIFITDCGDKVENIKTCLDGKFGTSGGKRKSRRTRKGKSKNKKRRTNRRRH